MTLSKPLNKLMSTATQAALWSLKRYDYYVNHSVVQLNNPDFYDNPYATYSTLRERGPILASAANRGWIVTGYEEVAELMQDKRISTDLRKNRFLNNLLKFAAGENAATLLDNPTMLNQDPPDHSRLRKLVSHGFMHKYIQSLAPTIERLVDEILDDIVGDQFDLIALLAKPLPAIVIAEMMGVPKAEQHKFGIWSEALRGLTEISNPEAIATAANANSEMRDYMANLAESKCEFPGQDLISQLIAAEEEGDRLTLDELYSPRTLLLTAGYETTTRLIGNCMYQVLQHPDQMMAARDSETCLENALEETLRFEPPVQNTIRFVHEPMMFRGKQLKAGQMM